MLSELYIDNIAVIEKASVVLGEGFNVFTGETGAGKSILLDSINAIIGERTSKDLIRSGCTKASVTALFCDISKRVSEKCAELGYEVDESGLLISRELTIDGRANCRICGKPATVSMLKEIGGDLIDIHGQHDNKNLLSAERHIRFIDNFGELQDEIKTYKDLYYNMVDIRQRLEAINTDESEKARKIDLLRYQIEEIDEANLTETEEDELIAERKMVKNSSRILDGLNAAYECLTGDGDAEGGCGLVSSASEAVSASAEYMDNLAEMSERLQGISIELEEFASDIRSALDDFEFDPRRIDYIEARLDVIYKLKRKYGAAVKDVLDYCENARRELEEIELSDELSEKLTAQLKKATEQAERQAEKLSGLRKKHAESFVQKVLSELAFLDMPNVIFTVEHNITEMKPNGVDSMEFMISTNPGETPKPLSRIASGGELSRIMLAIKNVIADKDDIDTLIFDEIDTGVSGRAAQKIGLKLKAISKGRQVICVTHHGQIAALGDNHMLIEKSVAEGKTYTTVKTLSRNERINEIARIMGGESITETMLKNAEEMLTLCGN